MSDVILGIETSCDETAAAVIRDGFLLSSRIATQEVHRKYGGVVPELASRAHQSAVVPVVELAIQEAGVKTSDLSGIAYTRGPGLLGALMVGASFAKGLALAGKTPLIPVHHMQAHIHAHFIEEPSPVYPFICLTVSGGHTQIVLVKGPFNMEILGETLDDAAGEAYDKSAKMLGLPYPGGPLVDKYAADGNPGRFEFSRPVVPGYDFSFSGFKTSVLYFLQRERDKDPAFIQKNMNDLCASIQHTINSILVDRLKEVAMATGITQIAIAGGVSANSHLRELLSRTAGEENWEVFIPRLAYCTDNAAMIAMSGFLAFQEGLIGDLYDQPMARMPFIQNGQNGTR